MVDPIAIYAHKYFIAPGMEFVADLQDWLWLGADNEITRKSRGE